MSVTISGNEVELSVSLGGIASYEFGPPPEVCVSAVSCVVQVAVNGRPVIQKGPDMRKVTIRVYEGDMFDVMARPGNTKRATVVDSDVDSVAVNVFDLSSATKGTAIHSEQLDVASVMLSAAYLDAGWNADSKGYTFIHTIDGRDWMFEGGRTYRLEYLFSTASYGSIKAVVEVQTMPLMSGRSEF